MIARERKQRFLNKIVAVKAFEPKPVQPPRKKGEAQRKSTKDQNNLSSQAKCLLVHVGLNPYEWLTPRYHALGFNLSEGKRIVNELVAKGHVLLHRIPRKGRGAQFVALQLSETGKQLVKEAGIEPRQAKLKGGFRHDLYGRLIGIWARERKWKVQGYECTLGGKTFDLVLETEGRLIGVEIIVSGSVRWNVQQLVKALGVEGINEIWVVVEKKNELEKICRGLNGSDLSQVKREKIKVHLCADFFS